MGGIQLVQGCEILMKIHHHHHHHHHQVQGWKGIITNQNQTQRRRIPKPPIKQQQQQQQLVKVLVPNPNPISSISSSSMSNSSGSSSRRRRSEILRLMGISAAGGMMLLISPPLKPSEARERRNRNTIPPQDYITTSDGIKYYDVVEGKGPAAEKGSTVQVHFDCVYRKITAVSSRESKLLAGNRIIAQPYEFQIGASPGKERKRDFVDNPNGLFSAQAAPKPPPAMYSVTEGMKVGGKRTVIVPPEAGYGQRGMNEIPPGATFELNIELLEIKRPEEK